LHFLSFSIFVLQRTKKPAFNYIFLTFSDHFDLITVVAKPHQLYLLFKPIYALYKLRLLMHYLKAGLVFRSSDLNGKNMWKVVHQKSVAFLQPFQYNH